VSDKKWMTSDDPGLTDEGFADAFIENVYRNSPGGNTTANERYVVTAIFLLILLIGIAILLAR